MILRTDWSLRWTDPNAFFVKDKEGQKHYPGWGQEALKYLIEEKMRAVVEEAEKYGKEDGVPDNTIEKMEGFLGHYN